MVYGDDTWVHVDVDIHTLRHVDSAESALCDPASHRPPEMGKYDSNLDRVVALQAADGLHPPAQLLTRSLCRAALPSPGSGAAGGEFWEKSFDQPDASVFISDAEMIDNKAGLR